MLLTALLRQTKEYNPTMLPPQLTADYSAWEDDVDPDATGARSAPLITLMVEEGLQGERLDKWLARQLSEHSRSRLQAWIEAGAVVVNGQRAGIRQALWGGDQVEVTPQAAPLTSDFAAEALALDVVFEDEAILVINKPAGLVVHPAAGNWTGTLLNGLLHHVPGAATLARAGIVHRLDKDTSGLMVVAKTERAQTDLVRQLQARTVNREYLAVVHGCPAASGTIDLPIGRHPRERTRMAVIKHGGPSSKPAITHFRVLQQVDLGKAGGGAYALVCCRLETGRTHQIRVHMQHIQHALVGDPVYGAKKHVSFGLARQALHAWRLGLIHPVTGVRREWSIAPPNDFLALLERLGMERGARHE